MERQAVARKLTQLCDLAGSVVPPLVDEKELQNLGMMCTFEVLIIMLDLRRRMGAVHCLAGVILFSPC
jgi:hypothetical protein